MTTVRFAPAQLALVLTALLGACGAAEGPGPTAAGAQTDLSAVPGWPPVPPVETSAAARMAELAASLEVLPRADGLQWADDTFVPWMSRREAVIGEAATLRRRGRGGPIGDQAVMAGLHGAILQHTFDALQSAEVERIDREAAEALSGPMTTLADKARRAYEACHQLALDAGVAFDGWRRGCDDHLGQLAD